MTSLTHPRCHASADSKKVILLVIGCGHFCIIIDRVNLPPQRGQDSPPPTSTHTHIITSVFFSFGHLEQNLGFPPGMEPGPLAVRAVLTTGGPPENSHGELLTHMFLKTRKVGLLFIYFIVSFRFLEPRKLARPWTVTALFSPHLL